MDNPDKPTKPIADKPVSAGGAENPLPPPARPGADPSQTRVYSMPDAGSGAKMPPPDGMPEQNFPPIPELDMIKPPRAQASHRPQWLYVIGGALLILFLLFILRKGASPVKPANRQPTQSDEIEQVTEPRPAAVNAPVGQVKTDNQQFQEVTDESFWGKANIPGSDAKPVIAADQDGEMAALAMALKNRAEVILGSSSSRWRNGVRKTVGGSYAGFKIQFSATMLPDIDPVEDLTITTPARGILHLQNGRLTSAKGSDLSKFKQELKDAGLDAQNNPAGAAVDKMVIRLTQASYPEIAADLLIADGQIGNVRVGMTTAKMDSLFPNTYILAKKRVLLGKTFYDIYKIHDEKQNPLLFVYELEGKIIGISPISDRYRTARGIGMGSSLGEMLINYGKVRFGFNPGQPTVAKLEGLDVQFFFEEQKIDYKAKIFQNDARIETILIGRAPAAEEPQ